MPAGSEGIIFNYPHNPDELVVRFWDGGPLRVPRDAVARIERRRRAPDRARDPLPQLPARAVA